MPNPSILCLVGSFETEEMRELSELYTQGCLDALEQEFAFTILHRSPDGAWRLSASLDPLKLARAKRLTFADAVRAVSAQRFDFGLPQMFCRAGMTAGRALFELLDIPMIGNCPVAMGLTADKALARSVVAAAGVNVPDGCVVRQGQQRPDLPPFPVIVKPVASDNSSGLSLVHNEAELQPALDLAFQDGDALVEQFIPPGRELRCAVIDWNGALLPLPPEEYPVGADRPVRTKSDKLARPGGVLTLAAKTAEAAWIIRADDPVIPALHDAAQKAYRALGCRHYGLFDFRVDDEGNVWFLEAGLYCSFSPQSVVAVMAGAAGIDLASLLNGFAEHLVPQVAHAEILSAADLVPA